MIPPSKCLWVLNCRETVRAMLAALHFCHVFYFKNHVTSNFNFAFAGPCLIIHTVTITYAWNVHAGVSAVNLMNTSEAF